MKHIFWIFAFLFTFQTGISQRNDASQRIPTGWANNSVNTVVFRKNSLITHGNTQIMAYYNPEGYMCLAKRSLGGLSWEIKQTEFKGNVKDAHNSISIMIDGQGYLHVAWDHHGNQLRYTKSKEPLSLELEEKQSMDGIKENKITYPEFYRLADGSLIFMYRDGSSGQGNLVMKKYVPADKKWTTLHESLIDGEGQRNAYWQACTDAKGTIHLSWVWRESPQVESNHDMCYARSNDGGKTWENSKAEKYTLPITAKTAEYAAKIPQNSELINQTSMTADENGNPYIATYYRQQNSTVPQYHVIYLKDGKWNDLDLGFRKTPFSLKGAGTKQIPIARPQIVAGNNKLYFIFRDAERNKRASIAVCDNLEENKWTITDLTSYSLGDWEPSYDTELWKNRGILNVFCQKAEQVDGEGVANARPQPVSVLNVKLDVVEKKLNAFHPGEIWRDNNGMHINAHGGGILFYNNKYYWFGEHKGEASNSAWVGVTCYSSDDLYNWTNEGVALPVVKNDKTHVISEGSVIERPKVIYNQKTGKFVMYFHLELLGQGYNAARVGIAVADNPTGPYELQNTLRPNAGFWPQNMTKEQQNDKTKPEDFKEWWTPEWRKAVDNGLFVRRDFEGGQMSRDMTLYVDDDGKAYHIYSSEENLTLHLAELTDDYLAHSGKYIRIAPGGHNEAPAIFKKDGRYFMIASGCTGWDPNAARLHTADHIFGPWTEHPNPCVGQGANLTFFSQSTFILPVAGKKDQFIFMADRWRPRTPIDGRYIWLPIHFENGLPVLRWHEKWDLNTLEETSKDKKIPEMQGYRLVWSDEFDYEGKPNPENWVYENGFVRNEELQWYQSDNAWVNNGILTIEGRKEQVKNPGFEAGSSNWRTNREYAEYTSTCIKTVGKKEFMYGRFEIRAKIPVGSGSWPAIWTLGKSMPWPSNGEIDIMEYYKIDGVPHILANTAWGGERMYHAQWNTQTVPFSKFTDKDPQWADKFHVWRMDWDEEAIRLYLDDELLNETFLENTKNGSIGKYTNPFKQPHYILLNLALGGHGGTPDDSAFPMKYEVDYVRVYQKTK